MHDTSPEAETVVRAAIRRRSPVERMREALALSDAMRALSLARLRREHPADSQLALVERLTGDSLRPGGRRGPSPGR